MFAKGTKIMYGNTGVCEVMDYATPDLPGMPRGTKYYVLRPLFQSGTIYCPVEQPKVFMRPVMSREEAERMLDALQGSEDNTKKKVDGRKARAVGRSGKNW